MLALPGLSLGSFVAESLRAYQRGHDYTDVPPLEPTLGVVGAAALDHTFTLAMNLLSGVPGGEVARSAHAELEAAQALFAAQGWLEKPQLYHRPPPAPQTWELRPARARQGARRVSYRHLTLPSDFSPHPEHPGRERWLGYQRNATVHAYVLEHAGAPRPWLVCVHGFSMGSPLLCFRGFDALWLHRELGLNLVMPVLPLHGPRSETRVSGGRMLQASYLNMVLTLAQAVCDVRSCLRWLEAHGASEVGVYGLSLGGCASALLACFEPELRCVIAGIPVADFANVARDNMPWMREKRAEFEIDWDALRSAAHVISPLAMTPLVPRERRFIFAGIADRVVRPDQARALWRHWDQPEIHWFAGSHVGYPWVASIKRFISRALTTSGLI
jgi:hypothetical protein